MKTKSFLLDVESWDLTLDEKGNIAITQNPYAVAQDVACSCKTELGECFYNKALGIPYFDKVFKRQAGINFVQSKLQTEAQKLPYVAQAQCTLTPNKITRTTDGFISIIDTNNENSGINL